MTESTNNPRGENDMLFGEAGEDTLLGQGGDDLLNGGADADILLGGAGADTFQFTEDALGAVDDIRDYVFAEGDVIDLAELVQVADGDNVEDYIQIDGNAGDDLVQVRDGVGDSWETIATVEVWEPGDGGFAAVSVIYDDNGTETTLNNVTVV